MPPTRRKLPQLILNLKNYPQAAGPRAVRLAKDTSRIGRELGVSIALCPQPMDVRACAQTGAVVYAQHFDRVERPESTGWLSLPGLVDAGCRGTLINHSEHRLPNGDAGWFVDAARDAGVVSVLCTKDAAESEALAAMKPTMVAIEPPELIGGDVSVTTADPFVVKRSVESVQRRSPATAVLCGAGVKSRADVVKARELGAYGILVASGVTKAKDPSKALRELAEGFR